MDRSEIHVGHGTAHLYHDGCTLCDAIEVLHVLGTTGSGCPWATDQSDEEEARSMIRHLLAAYNWRPLSQRSENWRVGFC